jgi:hypothetical protein
MNFQLQDTQKVPYSLTVADADGNPTTSAPGDTITVVSADTASVSVVPDATPATGTVASGYLVAGNKLQAGVAVTATLTPAAGGAPIVATDLIDVIAGVESALSFGLGAPVSQ